MKNAASEEERKKFLALIQYFQKYGDQYDVDWVLMGAQGYQESQLNQNAKSPVGAIGVMQVMPATGKDMKVGDITETEANIHAGIKYMRWMIDQYYEKEPMTKLDKALFAFASYNAGAGRDFATAQGSRQARTRPQRLVSERGVCGGREDRPGNGDLRQQHLQVLHCLPPGSGEPGCHEGSCREDQGWRQVETQSLRFITSLPRIALQSKRLPISPITKASALEGFILSPRAILGAPGQSSMVWSRRRESKERPAV